VASEEEVLPLNGVMGAVWGRGRAPPGSLKRNGAGPGFFMSRTGHRSGDDRPPVIDGRPDVVGRDPVQDAPHRGEAHDDEPEQAHEAAPQLVRHVELQEAVAVDSWVTRPNPARAIKPRAA